MPSSSFSRKKPQETPLFQNLILKGKLYPINSENPQEQLYYQHPKGQLWAGDAINWLKTLPSESADLVFADPPCDLKKTDWDTFKDQSAYIHWSLQWIEEVSRILRPDGTLYICGLSEMLADLKHPAMQFFKTCRWIVWHYKNKTNWGNDWGHSHQSILHFRKSNTYTFNTDEVRIPYGEHTLKYPAHSPNTSQLPRNGKKAPFWQPHPAGAKPKDVLEIPTTCNGMYEKTPHKNQKPEELLRKIILASSSEGETVLDPFVGSGTTMVCAEQLNRNWLGCDISEEYLGWAVNRLELVENWSIEKWKKYDAENQKRRTLVRLQ